MDPDRSNPTNVGPQQRSRSSHLQRDTVVEAECTWCGLVTLDIGEIGCLASEADNGGLCEFVCSSCGRIAVRGINLIDVNTLIIAGARPLTHAPLELLEPKTGDPLSWDDVLDFALAFKLEPLTE